MEKIKWDTVTKGTMTPKEFIFKSCDDMKEEEVNKIITAGGFLVNGQAIKNNESMLFKTGDIINYYQDLLTTNKSILEFRIV